MFNDVTINTSMQAWKNCFEGSASFMIVITENIAPPECNKEIKENMLNILSPDYVFLNFCNYLTRVKIDNLLKVLKEVTHVGFGPTIADILSVNR